MDNATSLLYQLHSDNCKKKKVMIVITRLINIWRLEGTACITDRDRANVMINWNLYR